MLDDEKCPEGVESREEGMCAKGKCGFKDHCFNHCVNSPPSAGHKQDAEIRVSHALWGLNPQTAVHRGSPFK